eukprot:TRINITY_DN173_c0_g1_i1.p1 TRINITY_DN173_c0_g1~~TRINITY_DN173_c0_g1_i1.p1  ORF type:complete len:106 (+),score=22.17 TRINITY_DN173_c0_g1_i1:596-913(+)
MKRNGGNIIEWGDYNLAFNNCEHFACFCATGVKRSGQVEKTVILVFNNCEHFASFCATGEKKSGQVKKAVIAGAVGVGVAAVVGLTVIGGMALMTRDNDRDEKER